jgi:hypothetical protein
LCRETCGLQFQPPDFANFIVTRTGSKWFRESEKRLAHGKVSREVIHEAKKLDTIHAARQ